MKVNYQHSLLIAMYMLFISLTAWGQQTFTTNQAANFVVGQANFTSMVTGCTATTTWGPAYCAISSQGVLAVVEQTGGRIKLWNNAITPNNTPCDVTLGAPNPTTCSAGLSQLYTYGASGVAFSPDGNKLIVSLGGQNRVLIWNTIPTVSGTAASVVIGQTNFNTGGAGVSSTQLNYPGGVFVSNEGKLFIVDRNNNRVLIYNSIPTTNGAAANVVLGQSTFTTATATLSASGLSLPWGIWVHGTKLLVAQESFNRVSVWNTIPTVNNQAADVFIGQTNGTTSAGGVFANKLGGPIGVTVAPDGKLAIAEYSNKRVLIFNSIPTSSGASADVVLGQPNFTTATNLYPGGAPTSSNFAGVYNASFDLYGRLFVVGRDMQRVMVFGTIPSSTASMGLSMTASNSTVCPSSATSITITITNNGPNTGTGVAVSTSLPAGFSLSGTSASLGTFNSGTNIWSIPSIPSGSIATLTLSGSSSAVGSATCYASITQSNQLDASLADNAASVSYTVVASITPSVTIATPSSTICAGNSSTFTASTTNGGTSPTYQWKVNGGNVGTNSSSYSTTTLTNGQVVSCVMTGNNSCQSTPTATSNSITMTVTTPSSTPSVSISSTDADNSFCPGTSVTFTATPTNGGASPSYQWKLNGVNVGSNSTTYTTTGITNGQTVQVVLTTNNGCASTFTASSAILTHTVLTAVTPAVTIASNDADNSFCAGTSVTFTATPSNGGPSPSYQWKVNGSNVGTNATTYNTTGLTNSQVVTVVMSANNGCQTTATATSSGITNTVLTGVTPSVSIVSNDGDNSFCVGTSVTFTATPVNGGTPSYQWKINGSNAGSNSATFSTSSLTNGQSVTVVMTPVGLCATPTTATSNAIANTVLTIQTYYVDLDGDGAGVTSSAVSDCVQPVSYVLVSGDCNDGNSEVSPYAVEVCNNIDDDCDGNLDNGLSVFSIYPDNDQDGYGLTAGGMASCDLLTNYVLWAGDCADNDANISPAAMELCSTLVDDDCDGLINENCGGGNDSPSFPNLLNISPNTTCMTTSGTLLGATPSSSFGSGAWITGNDLWYYFTAISSGISIASTSGSNDLALEIRASNGDLIKATNQVSGSGTEYLNVGGLVVGTQYKVRLINANGAQTGAAFSMCSRVLNSSSAVYYTTPAVFNSGCQNVSVTSALGATSYLMSLTPAAGPILSATGQQTQLSNFTGSLGEKFNFNTTYSLTVTANHVLPIGNGNFETIAISKIFTNAIVVGSHNDLDLTTMFACPLKVSNGWTVRANEWICGAVKYQWKFERMLNGNPYLIGGNPVIIEGYGVIGTRDYVVQASNGFLPGTEWRLQIRPVFPGNVVGEYGVDYQCMQMKGVLAMVTQEVNGFSFESELETESDIVVFPNPVSQGSFILHVHGMQETVFVEVVDAKGSIIFKHEYVIQDGGFQELDTRNWVNGMYTIRVHDANTQKSKRLIVSR